MTTTVSTDAVIGFRLAAHHLTEQVDARRLADATGQCGVQDSPPGSAALALHARVDGVTPEGLTTALDQDATLLRTWSLRGAPFVLPTADAAVFTTRVLPPTEGGRRHLVRGVEQSLDALGMSPDEVVDTAAHHVAAGRPAREGPADRRGGGALLPAHPHPRAGALLRSPLGQERSLRPRRRVARGRGATARSAGGPRRAGAPLPALLRTVDPE